jgi:P pilus assembly chaperone PapD
MTMKKLAARTGALTLGIALLSQLAATPASAELTVSQLIVEFKSGASRAADIEVQNNGDERSYAVVEPREITDPGLITEKSSTAPDPARLGLLASPARFILEPGQRRTLRIAAIGSPSDRERVYRVTVKPVTGDVKGEESGLKLLVGYDLLVLVRPAVVRVNVRAVRNGSKLSLTNDGNASVELAEGKQCDAAGKACAELPAKRLYAGATWMQELPRAQGGEYRIRSADGWSTVKF